MIKNGAVSGIVLLLLLIAVGHAAPFDDKSPAYFVDRYGPAKSSRVESKAGFTHTKYGSFGIKGPFSVREYRKDDLKVRAVFFYPSLRLAAVRLQFDHQWTREQIDAALAAYGGEWETIDRGPFSIRWQAPDGTEAISMLTWLDFQSKTVKDAVGKAAEEHEAKRKEVPKF